MSEARSPQVKRIRNTEPRGLQKPRPLFSSFRKGGEWDREEDGTAQGSPGSPGGKARRSPAPPTGVQGPPPCPQHPAPELRGVLAQAGSAGSREVRALMRAAGDGLGQRDTLVLMSFAFPPDEDSWTSLKIASSFPLAHPE